MNYEIEIYRVLTEAGVQGLHVTKISKHVCNACSSLFCPLDYTEVHSWVLHFLLRTSRKSDAYIERMGRRGYYRLKPKSQMAIQRMLMFSDGEQEENNSQPKEVEDQSLSLF